MGRRKEGERALARRWMYHYTPVIITFSSFFVLMTTTISYCFTISVICYFYFARILLPLKERGVSIKKKCALSSDAWCYYHSTKERLRRICARSRLLLPARCFVNTRIELLRRSRVHRRHQRQEKLSQR
jgi:hypothetical protein